MKHIYKCISYLFYTVALVFFVGVAQLMSGMQKIDVYPIDNTYDEYYEKQGEIFTGFLIFPLFAVVFLLLGIFFSSKAKRAAKTKKSTLSYKDIDGPFILYLRSFVDDNKTKNRISLLGTESEEEAIVQVMSDIAPVYAIGDPRDEYMPNGASRIYVDDDHWKEAVQVLSKKAIVVVLRLGETDSFWWEVKMTLDNKLLEKLLFIVPTTDSFKDVSILYRIMNEHGIDLDKTDISINKNDRGSIASFLYFDEKCKPQTSRVPTTRFTHIFLSYYDLMCNTLLPFRAKFGLNMEHTTIRKARILQICLILFFLFFTFSNLFSYLMILDSCN